MPMKQRNEIGCKTNKCLCSTSKQIEHLCCLLNKIRKYIKMDIFRRELLGNKHVESSLKLYCFNFFRLSYDD